MTKTLCIAVNGSAGTGKDTYVDMLIERLSEAGLSASKHSSVDRVKFIARGLGWDGVKDEAGRQFLSDLKDACTRYNDGPLRFMQATIQDLQHDVMFFHIREPREIGKFLSSHPGGLSLLIRRPDVETFGNHADQNVEDFRYSYVVSNSSSLESLRAHAKVMAEVIRMRHLNLG